MLNNRCHIKKDDKVKITAGKDKGKVGKSPGYKKKEQPDYC